MNSESTFTAVTYNIHRCRGADGSYDPYRVARVLRSIRADVIGLQEVDTSLMVPLCDRRHTHRIPKRNDMRTVLPAGADTCGGLHQLDFLSLRTHCNAVEGLIMERGAGEYGNAILTRHEVREVRRIDLTVRGSSERRGALDVDLVISGRPVRLIVTHLGLQIWERHFQIARLIQALGRDYEQQLLIMGDFNLLLSMFPKLRRFYRRLGHTPLAATFPSCFPLLPLDRIWSQPAKSLVKMEVIRTPLSRVASDHLPLKATVAFPQPAV